jgi:hypothetical protein
MVTRTMLWSSRNSGPYISVPPEPAEKPPPCTQTMTGRPSASIYAARARTNAREMYHIIMRALLDTIELNWIDAHLGRVDVQEEAVFRAEVLRNHEVPLRAVAALFLRLPLAFPAGSFLRRLKYIIINIKITIYLNHYFF